MSTCVLLVLSVLQEFCDEKDVRPAVMGIFLTLYHLAGEFAANSTRTAG